MRGLSPLHGTLALLIAGSVWALPAVSLAQNEAAARQAFAEGTRQFQAANFALAEQQFRRSYELMAGDPARAAVILYNVGRAQEELGRYGEALASYEAFMRDSPANTPERATTPDRIRELRARVGSGVGSPVVLSGIILVGIGGAAAIAAIPTGIIASDDRAQLDDLCSAMVCPPDAQPLIDEGQTLAVVTDVLWISGVSLLAIGATVLTLGLVGITGDSMAGVTPSLGCGPDGCVAGLTGTFGR